MNFKVSSNTGLILMLIFIVLVAFFGPLFTIWALNTLFPALAIPFTFETWAAVILLGIFIRGDGIKFGDKK
jgi:hypothetical protein